MHQNWSAFVYPLPSQHLFTHNNLMINCSYSIGFAAVFLDKPIFDGRQKEKDLGLLLKATGVSYALQRDDMSLMLM